MECGSLNQSNQESADQKGNFARVCALVSITRGAKEEQEKEPDETLELIPSLFINSGHVTPQLAAHPLTLPPPFHRERGLVEEPGLEAPGPVAAFTGVNTQSGKSGPTRPRSPHFSALALAPASSAPLAGGHMGSG